MDGITTPTWTQIGEMQNQIDELHVENALKLKQILDLEQILYDTRIAESDNGSPCWCKELSHLGHEDYCIKARQATESFWKGVKK